MRGEVDGATRLQGSLLFQELGYVVWYRTERKAQAGLTVCLKHVGWSVATSHHVLVLWFRALSVFLLALHCLYQGCRSLHSYIFYPKAFRYHDDFCIPYHRAAVSIRFISPRLASRLFSSSSTSATRVITATTKTFSRIADGELLYPPCSQHSHPHYPSLCTVQTHERTHAPSVRVSDCGSHAHSIFSSDSLDRLGIVEIFSRKKNSSRGN